MALGFQLLKSRRSPSSQFLRPTDQVVRLNPGLLACSYFLLQRDGAMGEEVDLAGQTLMHRLADSINVA